MALRRERLDDACKLIERTAAAGEVGAAALYVSQGDFELSRGFGAAKSPDKVFLLASITKPMTATGLMRLCDRKEVALSDPVRKFIPEFHGDGRDEMTLRHLLTHTSGLPDMLPENDDLRKRHAPLSDFVQGAIQTPLLFRPGTDVRYQSMGILLASEIARRITKRPFEEFLRDEVFQPLAMKQTSLGMGGRRIEDTARCEVPQTGWDWNSPYWRNLGSPWGGAHAPAADVARFLRYFLKPDNRVLKPATAASMIVNQNEGLDDPRGLGFMVKPGSFGRHCSPRAFGHSGSTGTIAWADPASGLICVVLTTKPAAQSNRSLLHPVSDLVSDSV